jgi:isopenicillin N synthase-like dioxygenase
VEELRVACHTIGFFLLRHDISSELTEQQMEETRRFFQQPLETKLEISYEDSPAFRGYMKLGVENTAGKMDYREQVEFAAESDFSDATKTTGSTTQQQQQQQHNKHAHCNYDYYYERLRGRNPWPSFQPTLETVTMQYVQNVNRIADCLREAMCMALGLDKDALSPLFRSHPHWVLKLVCYPPVEKDNCNAASSLGVGPHTDTNFLTLVLQDDVGGLQVFSQQGEWRDVPSCTTTTAEGSIPNILLVCNIGEQAQIWSRGYFLATPHRVQSPTTTSKTRISVPFFYNPMLEATITPILNCDDSTIPSSPWEERSETKQHHHWKQDNNNNAMLTTVGENTFKSLARSHPLVFAKHHSDLLLLEDGRIVPRETQS